MAVSKNDNSAEDRGIRVMGHWMYCRRCKTPEGSIALADYFVDASSLDETSCWYEILALGPRVGKPRTSWTKKLRKERGVPRCMPNDKKVGDIVLCARRHPWAFRDAPRRKDGGPDIDMFIDEVVPEAVVSPDDEAPDEASMNSPKYNQ